MAASQTFPLVSDEALEELSERGQALYATLRAQIEPEHDRKFVAIHVDSGDYEIARSSGDAMRAMHKRRPADGRLYIRKIGTEPEYGLAARLLASDMRAGEAK